MRKRRSKVSLAEDERGSLAMDTLCCSSSERLDLSVLTKAGVTRRERDIIELVAKGLSNKEIGAKLNISVFTVKNHVHHILRKLHLKRRAQLIRML